MMIPKKRKGFTIIELIVVIAILGILVLLASMMFKGYVEKARITRIKNDIKATETVMASKLIDDEHFIDNWGNISDTKLQEFAEQDGLYDKKGKVDNPDKIIPGNYKKIEKEEIKDQLKSDLPGDFYINEKEGEVYYHDKNDETVEVDPPLTEAEIDDLVNNEGYIPIANADELNQIKAYSLDDEGNPVYQELIWGKNTKWEGNYTGKLDSKYIQVADIDLGSFGESYDGGQGWVPIGSYKSQFTGIYNGGNYSINNLYTNRGGPAGLFAFIDGNAAFKNISLKGQVISSGHAGGLAGFSHCDSYGHISLSNINIDVDVTGSGGVGGIIGQSFSEVILSDVNVISDILGTENTGGIIGMSLGETSITSASVKGGTIKGNSQTGGIIGNAYGQSDLNHIYVNTNLESYGPMGGVVGFSNDDLNINNATVEGKLENPTVYGGYLGGVVGASYSTVTLSSINVDADIEGNGVVGGVIGSSFNNLSINNAIFKGPSISSKTSGHGDSAGGLVGAIHKASEPVVLNNITVETDVSGVVDAGGIIGLNFVELELEKASFKGVSMSSNGNAGGAFGRNYSNITLSDININASVKSEFSAGGIFGLNSGFANLSNSSFEGDSTSSSGEAGGIIGVNYDEVSLEEVRVDADIVGVDSVGGLIGFSSNPVNVDNSSFIGSVTAPVDNVGGLIGQIHGPASLNNIDIEVNLTGSNNVGGLVGFTSTPLNVNNTTIIGVSGGSISGNNFVGGVAGKTNDESEIRHTTVDININGADSVAGLIGYITEYAGSNKINLITEDVIISSNITGESNTGQAYGQLSIRHSGDAFAGIDFTGAIDGGSGLIGGYYQLD